MTEQHQPNVQLNQSTNDQHPAPARQPDKDKSDILLNTFLISNKKYRVLLHHANIVWERENSQNEKTTVPLTDILAVRLGSGRRHLSNLTDSRLSLNPSISSSPSSGDASQKSYLYIFYAKREIRHRDHNRWRKYAIKLYNTDPYVAQKWHSALNDLLLRQKRPKNVLMFINPYGGKRQALKVFEKYSKPLFQLAGVEINCLISQRGNQIHDILLNNPALDQYDAICCVGGDGTFSEVFNGLMQRTLKDLDLDPQRPKYLPKLRIPVGVIPAGSTDTVAYCLHGTTDVKTAVIHIILGQTRGLDLSSVCNHSGLVRLYASLICYGYLGDIALDSEQYRWMGPRRYDYSGFKKFVANNGYEIEICFPEPKQPDETSSHDIPNPTACKLNCPRCSDPCIEDCIRTHVIDYSLLPSMKLEFQTASDTVLAELKKWRTVRGKYFMVAGANISCASSRTPNGLAPFSHLGDGFIDVIVVRHTSTFNLLRLLMRLSRDDPKIDMLPFVEIYRTDKFVFRSQKLPSTCDLTGIGGSRQRISSNKSGERTSQWNCDGELIFDTDLLISSHRQLLDVFMRGADLPPEIEKSTCCVLCGSGG